MSKNEPREETQVGVFPAERKQGHGTVKVLGVVQYGDMLSGGGGGVTGRDERGG